MSGTIQNSVILFKPETTSGTDAAPTNTTDAVGIRVSGLDVKITELFADRDVMTQGFAGTDKLPYTRRGNIKFSVELQASGTLGTAPQWGDLLLCCGFAETVTATTRVDYVPASASLKTATVWAYVNGRLEKFVYCAGDVSINAEVGKVPSLDFEFTGLVSSVAANATVSPTLTAWIRAEAVGPADTTPMSIGAVTYSAGAITGGTTYPFRSLNVKMGNDVQDLPLVQTETVQIYGREPTGEIVADLGGTAHAAFKADMHAGTNRAFGFVHGSTAGKKVGIYAPVGVITAVEDVVDGKVMLDKLAFNLRPSVGNDELRIFCI
jgi:hypothetical protein